MDNKNVIAGRYELIEKIGDGGMAVVYKAKCRLLKRFVAVKILKPEFTKDIKFVENFRRESHAAASLSHQNIVSIFDVGQEGNVNYIVMELVDGKTLSEVIDERSPLNYKEAIDYAKQIAQGLWAAHKNGIIHRDVKPHNILVTSEGVLKITDFGIAKAVSDTTIVDSSKEQVMGSVHYFSPEQAKGAKVDEKSDIYSFGILLFEMLTGKVPFDGDNPVTVALMQINEMITPPSVYNHNIPPNLEKIVLKATEKNPESRFHSFGEILEALDNVTVVGRVMGDTSVYRRNDAIDNAGYSEGISDGYGENVNSKMEYNPSGTNMRSTKNKSGNKRGRNRKKIIGIVALAVIVVGIIGSIFVFGSKKNIEVPDLKGMTLEEAEQKVKEVNLKIEVDGYEESDKVKRDGIISQNPEAGTKVAKGEIIKVKISKGNVKGIVPNLIGKTQDEAKQMAEEYGFSIGTVSEKASDKPKGTVIEQSPKAGAKASGVTSINIVISDGSGKEKVEVPNLLGMTKEAAKKSLENLGLKLGKVTEGVSDEYGKDQIIWQSYNSGTKVEKNETVDIKINKGEIGKVNIYLPLDEAKSDTFILDIVVSDEAGKNRHVVNKKKYRKNGQEMVTIEGTGRGVISVRFDGVEVLRKEVKFS